MANNKAKLRTVLAQLSLNTAEQAVVDRAIHRLEKRMTMKRLSWAR